MPDYSIMVGGVQYDCSRPNGKPYSIWAEKGIREKPDNDLPMYPWTVVDNGMVVALTCPNAPRVQYTTKEHAQKIADAWNAIR